MERKIIITLREPISNGTGSFTIIHADSVVVDTLTGLCIGYYIDNIFLFIPIDNVLGTFLNPNYNGTANNAN